MQIVIFQEGNNAANSYLGFDETTKQAFIVDPGREDKTYQSFLEENGLKLDTILITHAHYDHINGVLKLQKETGARIIAAEAEKPYLQSPSLNFTEMVGRPKTIEADTYVKAGDTIEPIPGTVLTVIPTPGHTPGGICFYDKADDILFSGDTLFQGSIGRTDFPGGSYDDIMRSLDTLMELPPRTHVLSGHGQPTTIEAEKKTNPFYLRQL